MNNSQKRTPEHMPLWAKMRIEHGYADPREKAELLTRFGAAAKTTAAPEGNTASSCAPGTSCLFACLQSCQEGCKAGCQDTCKSSCQDACKSACKDACKSSCQSACKSSCQSSCEVNCQMTCMNSCQEITR